MDLSWAKYSVVFQAIYDKKHSENETEPCNKENQLAWTKEVVKKHSLTEVIIRLMSIGSYM